MKEHDTILVTGGAGFIGGNFVLRQLERSDTRIVNLDAMTYAGNPDTLAPIMGSDRHCLFKGSINDDLLVKRLLREAKPRAIVHFAAESHVDRSIDGPEAFIRTNVLGTHTLLEAARQYWNELEGEEKRDFRFLHVSTDEVFGSLGDTGLFTEASPYQPNSPYSASKAGADHLVRAYFHTYGLPTLTTHCSNNYGPHQFPEKLVPLMIQRGLAGQSLPIYGSGTNVRDWLHVEDHCLALERVLEAGIPGETYNIGGNNERSNIEVVEKICQLMNELCPQINGVRYQRLITHVKDRPGHDHRYAIDATKMRRELNWEPQESFETGFRKTVIWYLEHQSWCQRVMDGSYRGERLGALAA